MLRLNLKREAEWLDLGHGVRVLVDPLTPSRMNAARESAVVRTLVESEAPVEEIGIAVAREVAIQLISAWEGVGDENGAPLDVSAEGVLALLDLWPMYSAFEDKYLRGAMLLELEKNGSALSPSGTSAGVRTTARRARGGAKPARKPKTRR